MENFKDFCMSEGLKLGNKNDFTCKFLAKYRERFIVMPISKENSVFKAVCLALLDLYLKKGLIEIVKNSSVWCRECEGRTTLVEHLMNAKNYYDKDSTEGTRYLLVTLANEKLFEPGIKFFMQALVEEFLKKIKLDKFLPDIGKLNEQKYILSTIKKKIFSKIEAVKQTFQKKNLQKNCIGKHFIQSLLIYQLRFTFNLMLKQQYSQLKFYITHPQNECKDFEDNNFSKVANDYVEQSLPTAVSTLLDSMMGFICRVNIIFENLSTQSSNTQFSSYVNQSDKFYSRSDKLNLHRSFIFVGIGLQSCWVMLPLQKVQRDLRPTQTEISGKQQSLCKIAGCQKPEIDIKAIRYSKEVRYFEKCGESHRFHKHCIKKYIQENILGEKFSFNYVACPVCSAVASEADLIFIFGKENFFQLAYSCYQKEANKFYEISKLEEEKLIKERPPITYYEMKCCKVALENDKSITISSSLDLEALRTLVLSSMRYITHTQKGDPSTIEFQIECPNCYNKMESQDFSAIIPEETVNFLLSHSCLRCHYIFKFPEREEEDGMRQHLECKDQHTLCSSCIWTQCLRGMPVKPEESMYPHYSCPGCQHSDCEFSTVLIHKDHAFDLFSLIYSYFWNNSIQCLDLECKNKLNIHPVLQNMLKGFVKEEKIMTHRFATEEEVKQLNNYLFRFYCKIIETKEEMMGAYVIVRHFSYVPCKFIANFVPVLKQIAYPFPNWDNTKNNEDIYLREMAPAEQSFEEAKRFLHSFCNKAEVMKIYFIQNSKQYNLFAEHEGKIPNKKLMAILCPVPIQKQFMLKPLVLDLLGICSAQGRGVYLTETIQAHDSALKEEDEFSIVLAQVLLGEGGAQNILKSNTTLINQQIIPTIKLSKLDIWEWLFLLLQQLQGRIQTVQPLPIFNK